MQAKDEFANSSLEVKIGDHTIQQVTLHLYVTA